MDGYRCRHVNMDAHTDTKIWTQKQTHRGRHMDAHMDTGAWTQIHTDTRLGRGAGTRRHLDTATWTHTHSLTWIWGTQAETRDHRHGQTDTQTHIQT